MVLTRRILYRAVLDVMEHVDPDLLYEDIIDTPDGPAPRDLAVKFSRSDSVMVERLIPRADGKCYRLPWLGMEAMKALGII